MKNPYTTKLHRALASVLLCGITAQAQAFNIISTDSRYEASGVRYYFTVNNWTTNDNSRSPCIQPSPGSTTCVVEVTANQSPFTTSSVGTSLSWDVPLRSGYSTMGQLLVDLQSKGFRIPLNGSVLVPYNSVTDDLCITFTYAAIGPSIGGAVSRFGPCTPVMAPTLQCQLTGDTTINHKNLSDNEVNGAKASTQLNLQCQGPSSVTVSTSRTDYSGVKLRSDGSLYSKITINGMDAYRGIDVQVSKGQIAKLNITSTLSTRGTVAPGEFSGSTVISISPP
ncbi:hypothetical protein D3C76_481740 [compost metagenome]|jgi:hypothetical protein|uniref:MrpH family fimbial adhesin n=1 Tax=Pseudomonas sp. P1B16 TaxID=2986074 RepID=UPI000FA84922